MDCRQAEHRPQSPETLTQQHNRKAYEMDIPIQKEAALENSAQGVKDPRYFIPFI